MIEMGVYSRFLVLVSRTLDTMEVFKVALFYTCMAAFFGERYCEGCTNDLTGKSAGVRLLNDLFCSYNKNVRPVMNPSTQTVVNTTFYIFSVHMNEEWDVLQMSIQLIMAWKDEFLTWDPSKYENIETINTESTKMWLPNIMSYDMGFNGDNTDYSYFLPASVVKVNSKGIAKYNHRIQLTARCSADVFNWPFDSHNCTFLVGSPTFGNKLVNFSFPNGYFDLDYYSADREWEVANVEHSCLDIFGIQNASHCLLKYDVNIVRFSTMYFSSIIIPAVVISLMRTFTFLMGHETYLRIILLCLFFISELLFLQYLDIKIPNNGEESVLIILLYRNSLLLSAMAIIICIISNELYKRGTEDFPRNGPEWLKSVSRFLLNKRPITLLASFNTQGAEHLIEKNVEEDVPNSQRDENASFWKTLSILLDRISFIITLVTSLICFWAFIP